MGFIVTPSSRAAVTAVGAKNVSFVKSVTNRKQKILIIGAALAAKAGTYTANTPRRMYSADEAGSRYGMGGPLHSACYYAFQAHKGAIETWVAPQAESGTGVAATTGGIEFTSAATKNGYVHIYINGISYKIWATTTDTVTNLGDKLVTELTANPMCPVTGVNTSGDVVFTCKVKGTWGNDINIATNQKAGEEYPTGIALTITPMSTGANDPSVADVLTVLGADDAANGDDYTDVIVCYDRLGDTTMDALSVYNGTGDEVEACYSETVHKPFNAYYGDCDAGSAALTALNVIGAARRELDRTNCAIPFPGSNNHPTDAVAYAVGFITRTANIRAAEPYTGKALPLIMPGAVTDQWTVNHTSRESAVENGISTTVVDNGVVKLQNIMTFYHPEAVDYKSNGYASVRNCKITGNILKAHYDRFNTEDWQAFSIVEDVTQVGSTTDREKVKDRNSVVGELFSLADDCKDKAWLYNATFTKERIADNLSTHVVIREGSNGFDTKFPVVYSGEGGIINGEVQFDINLAVVTG